MDACSISGNWRLSYVDSRLPADKVFVLMFTEVFGNMVKERRRGTISSLPPSQLLASTVGTGNIAVQQPSI